ncbi:MAG: hypothetical protein V3U11_03925 [Planctomycetota bacterium]
MRVEVYWNTRRKLYSIRAMEGPDKGRVIDHDDLVELKDVSFHVSEPGRLRVVRSGRKNLHATVRGEWMEPRSRPLGMGDPTHVRYNPMHDKGFQHEGQVVKKATWVLMYRSGRSSRIAAYEVTR